MSSSSSNLNPEAQPDPVFRGGENPGAPAVLVVEDDAEMRSFLGQLLESDGFTVSLAGSAAVAEKQLAERLPQAVLLDLHLPDASGGSLVRKILRLAPGVPVIAMTAYGQIADAVEVLKLGAHDYILKEASVLANVPMIVRRALADLEMRQKLSLAEEELHEHIKRQAAIAQFGVRAISLTSIEELFDEATRLITRMVDVEAAKIQQLQPGGKQLRLLSGAGWEPGEIGRDLSSAGPETPAGLALQTGTPVVIEDLAEDRRFDPPDLLTRHGLVSGVTVLIHGPAGPFGVLGMHGKTRRKFSRGEVDFLQAMANILGAALGRAEAEERLRREENFWSTMTESMGALMVVLDREGRIISFNHACQQLTGYTFDEVEGKVPLEFLIPEVERDGVRDVVRRWFNGEHYNEFENHWVTKDGSQRLISWSNSVIPSASGGIEVVVATGIDITERRRLERELLEAAERERQRLGRDLHDDLCQYLAGIGMMVASHSNSLAASGLISHQSEADRIGGEIKEALAHARLLAHGLAPLRSETGDMTVAFEELALYVKKVFRVSCHCALSEEVALGDVATATQLYRISQEAVHNAVRHGRATQIEISASRQPDGVLVFQVADNGCGFASPSGGTGIRNMEQRATLIGGQLKVESTPGAGTVVTCRVRSVAPSVPATSKPV